jgi:hypothetical protein
MKNKFACLGLAVLLGGCIQDYPETAGDGGNDKACLSVVNTSTIEVKFDGGNIPTKLSGWVNGMAVVNECTLGSDHSSYQTVRQSDGSLGIVLRVDNNAAMSEMFFDDDGTPKLNVLFQFVLRGRNNCNDSLVQLYSTVRSLEWKPVYSNNNKGCGPSGYSAKVFH